MSQTNGHDANKNPAADDSSPTKAQPEGELDEAELDTVSGGGTNLAQAQHETLKAIVNNLRG